MNVEVSYLKAQNKLYALGFNNRSNVNESLNSLEELGKIAGVDPALMADNNYYAMFDSMPNENLTAAHVFLDFISDTIYSMDTYGNLVDTIFSELANDEEVYSIIESILNNCSVVTVDGLAAWLDVEADGLVDAITNKYWNKEVGQVTLTPYLDKLASDLEVNRILAAHLMISVTTKSLFALYDNVNNGDVVQQMIEVPVVKELCKGAGTLIKIELSNTLDKGMMTVLRGTLFDEYIANDVFAASGTLSYAALVSPKDDFFANRVALDLIIAMAPVSGLAANLMRLLATNNDIAEWYVTNYPITHLAGALSINIQSSDGNPLLIESEEQEAAIKKSLLDNLTAEESLDPYELLADLTHVAIDHYGINPHPYIEKVEEVKE